MPFYRIRGVTLLILLAAAVLAHAQTPISSTLDLAAYADADIPTVGDVTSLYSTSQGATLALLSGSVDAYDSFLSQSVNYAHAFSSAAANWVDAGEGTLHLGPTGWDFSSGAPCYVAFNAAVVNHPVWTYTFDATADGTFNVDLNVVGTGDTQYLNGIIVQWSGPGGDYDAFGTDPTTSTSFSRSVKAGTRYTVGVYSFAGLGYSYSVPGVAGSYAADVHWKVNAVPEPASLAAFGVGAIALVRRRLKA